jgi:adenosylhomocysteine nucleosidase
MLLRWLVNQYVEQAARTHVQRGVADVLRSALGGQQTAAAGESPGADRPSRESSPGDESLAPPCDLLIAFALGIEAGGTVDLLTSANTARVGGFTEHAGKLGAKEAVVIATGVGGPAAAAAVANAIDFHEPLWVISAGFAGALAPDLRRGHMLMASEVVQADASPLKVGLSVPQSPGLHVGRLVTVDKLIRTRQAKDSLARQHQAIACDMESYAIAEVCREKNVRFLSVRIISDALDDELPKEVERLLSQKTVAGKLGAAASAIFQRPGSALDLFKLQDEALKAPDRLAKLLASVVAQLE